MLFVLRPIGNAEHVTESNGNALAFRAYVMR